ncbi:MAG: nucleotide-binding protein [Bacteroidota bacterium]
MNNEEILLKIDKLIEKGSEIIQTESLTRTLIEPTLMQSISENYRPRYREYKEIDLAQFNAWFARCERFLKEIFGDMDSYTQNFQNSAERGTADSVKSGIEILKAAKDDLPNLGLASFNKDSEQLPTFLKRKVFIVHGHDEAMKESVARFLEKLDVEAIILHEQPDKGRTIIEKFEDQSLEANFAIVLFSPDDYGFPKDFPKQKRLRPRQNVVFELGYFIGKIKRKNVIVLFKEGVDIEILSDFQGMVYKIFDNHGGWQLKLANELIAAGLEIDKSRL